jgi:hypothetical protein
LQKVRNLILICLQFLQDVELVWGNAMLYNPSDNVVHKDAVFMRNIWHQQTLKNLAKEVTFDISTNCTSTPDTRLQVFLAWAQQQFDKLFPPAAIPAPSSIPLAASVGPSAKKLKLHCAEATLPAAQDCPPMNTAPKTSAPNIAIRLSFQSKPKLIPASSADNSPLLSRVSAAHSPLPSKSPAAALVVAPQQVAAAPASKLFDISAVPVVKVSGPLLRSCSKAISTMTSDPDMIWFVSPGEIASLGLTNAPARAPRERDLLVMDCLHCAFFAS